MKLRLVSHLSLSILVCLFIGCKTESVQRERYPYDGLVPIVEDSTATIVSASDITVLDADRAIISQFINGRLLLLDLSTGHLTRTIIAPTHITDTALTFARTQTGYGPFRPISLDSATSFPGSGMSSPILPKSHRPQYIRVALHDHDRLDVITRVEIPGVSLEDGNFVWMTIIGITTLTTTDFSVLKFTPLEVRGERFPQFLFFSPIATGGWWHGTFDFGLWMRDSTATLPLLVRFDAAGHQSTVTIPLPNEAKNPGYFSLTNDIVKTSDAGFGILSAGDGSLILGNFNDQTTHHVPLISEELRKEFGFDSSTTYVYPCLLDDDRIEIVASSRRADGDSVNSVALEYAIDWTAYRARLTAIRTPKDGYVVGPGTTITTRTPKGTHKEMIRLMYDRTRWFLVRKIIQ